MIQPAVFRRLHQSIPAGILEFMNAFRRLGIILSLSLAGCGGGTGDDLPRQAVSGSVTLNDKPLEQGSITFSPAEPGQGAPSAGAIIKSGSYSIDRSGGPTPGKYRVSIVGDEASAASEELPGLPPKLSELKKKARIPEKYNARSNLTAEVKADGSNSIDFDLKIP
jgi:hypothetical protein